MTEVQISNGVWTANGDGSISAAFQVTVDDGVAQDVTAYVDADSRAHLGIEAEAVTHLNDRLTERAHWAIEYLASNGRLSPELRLTIPDIAGVVEDDHPDHATDTADESGPEA